MFPLHERQSLILTYALTCLLEVLGSVFVVQRGATLSIAPQRWLPTDYFRFIGIASLLAPALVHLLAITLARSAWISEVSGGRSTARSLAYLLWSVPISLLLSAPLSDDVVVCITPPVCILASCVPFFVSESIGERMLSRDAHATETWKRVLPLSISAILTSLAFWQTARDTFAVLPPRTLPATAFLVFYGMHCLYLLAFLITVLRPPSSYLTGHYAMCLLSLVGEATVLFTLIEATS